MLPLKSQQHAPSDLTLRQWNIEDGLPQSTVRCMIRTRDGFMWVGTWHGIARFDGVQFRSYSAKNVPAFTSDQIDCLYEDREGNLWIGTTGGGLVRFDGGTFRRFGDEAGLSTASATDILETLNGTLLFGTSNGLFTLKGDSVVLHPMSSHLPLKEIDQLQTDSLGRIWARTTFGTFRFSENDTSDHTLLKEIRYTSSLQPDGSIWFEYRPFGLGFYSDASGYAKYEGFYQKALSTIRVTAAGDLWIGTLDDVTRIRNGSAYRYDRIDDIAMNSLIWIADDDEGNLWTSGSGKGLIRLRWKRMKTYTRADGLSTETVTSVLQRKDGSLFVGTDGMGVNVRKTGRFERYTGNGNDFTNAYALLEDHRRAVWIGTWGGGLFKLERGTVTSYRKNGMFPEQAVTSLAEDRDGTLWIGTPSNGLFTYNGGRFERHYVNDLHEGMFIDCLIPSRNGGVWMGTRRFGLFRINGMTLKMYDRTNLLASDFVQVLYEDERGVLWIGTTAGLSRLEGTDGFTYSIENGLTDGVVTQLLEDHSGALWYGGLTGIHKIPRSDLDEVARGTRKTVRIQTYGKQDGMPVTEVHGGGEPGAWKDTNGHLWFTTGAGLIEVDPKQMERTIPPPQPVVEAVLVDGTARRKGGTIQVNPGDARMEVSYTGPSFASPENIIFRYRLEGFDDEWIEAGHRRHAVYTNLPYGSYLFHVAASNGDDLWLDEENPVRIEVLAPFWHTPWFMGLVVLFILFGGPAVYFYRTRQLQQHHAAQVEVTSRILAREEEARKKIAGELHDNLAQKLVLLTNRVRRTSKLQGTGELTKELEAIEELARTSLDDVKASSRELRPLHLEELGLARSLLSLARAVREATELDLRTEIDISVTLDEKEHDINVYRIAQEALNNVVRHSRSPSATLFWEVKNGTVILRLKDKGIGLPASGVRNAGLGFRSMKERARMIGAKLDIRPAETGGTIVELLIPKKNGKHT